DARSGRGGDRVRDGGGGRNDRRLAHALRAAGTAIRCRVLHEDGLDLRRIGARQQLVVEQRRVALAAVIAVARPLEGRVANDMTTPPVTWPIAPVTLMTRP